MSDEREHREGERAITDGPGDGDEEGTDDTAEETVRFEDPITASETVIDDTDDASAEPADDRTTDEHAVSADSTETAEPAVPEADDEDVTALEKRSQRLDEREMGLDSRAERLDEREARLEEREHALVEQRESLEAEQAALDEREATISERETELDERETAISERETELEEYARELDQRDQTLREYVNDQVGESVEEVISAALDDHAASTTTGRFGPTGGLLLGLVGLVLVVGGVANALATEAGAFSALLGSTTANVVLSAGLILLGLAGNLAAATDRI